MKTKLQNIIGNLDYVQTKELMVKVEQSSFSLVMCMTRNMDFKEE